MPCFVGGARYLFAVNTLEISLSRGLPPILWMGVILSASTNAGSAAHTSRFIGPLLHWLFPAMDQSAIDSIHFLIRKTAHLTEYAILAILWSRALRQPSSTPWRWQLAAAAVVLCFLVASIDEFSQSFRPSRQGSPYDVLLDTVGASIGVGLIWLWEKTVKRR